MWLFGGACGLFFFLFFFKVGQMGSVLRPGCGSWLVDRPVTCQPFAAACQGQMLLLTSAVREFGDREVLVDVHGYFQGSL